MSSNILPLSAGLDIRCWFRHFKGICPTCGADMNKFDLAQDIYCHFAGTCLQRGWGGTVTTSSNSSKNSTKEGE
jgi:hypothetical protein